METLSVRRVDFGFFVRPPEETGTGAARVEPCLGYVIDHHDGVVLVDTGMGSHPEVDAHYHPARRPLPLALGDAGIRSTRSPWWSTATCTSTTAAANPNLAGRPIVTQRIELEAARGVDYTLRELIDAPGLVYEEIDGEAEALPGVLVVPTPGHTAGHQSVVVQGSDGTVVVAGQSHDTASAYSADRLAWRAAKDGHGAALPMTPEWIDRLQALDPRRVVFAHDHSVWEP